MYVSIGRKDGLWLIRRFKCGFPLHLDEVALGLCRSVFQLDIIVSEFRTGS